MSDTIIVALLGLAGTFVGSFSGIKLIAYRLQELENKVEKHNQVVERVFKIERHEAVIDEKIEHLEAYHK